VGHRWYGTYLTKVGRQTDALTQFQIALSLDPVSPPATQTMGMPLYFMHRYPEAIAQFREALLLEPNFGMTHQS